MALSRTGIVIRDFERNKRQIMSNLNKQIRQIKGGSMQGLIESSIVIRRDMDSTMPLVPVDLGNLRASWFTVNAVGGGDPNTPVAPQFKGRTPSEQARAAEMAALHSATRAALQSSAAAKKTVLLLYMGFSANYATVVHEMEGMGKREETGKGETYEAMLFGSAGQGFINWKRPGSGPKFFEAAIKRNVKNILNLVKVNATIKR